MKKKKSHPCQKASTNQKTAAVLPKTISASVQGEAVWKICPIIDICICKKTEQSITNLSTSSAKSEINAPELKKYH